MTSATRQVRLAARPDPRFRPEHFELAETSIAPPGEGQLLLRLRWLSMDPMLRIFLNPATMGAALPPMPIGAPVVGPVVGEVVESRADGFSVGDHVEARAPWQDVAVLDAAACRRLRQGPWPEQTAVGALGMPGFSAWVGLELLQLAAGDTLLVSGAAGTVGSIAGQLARARGVRVVGIAGGAERCAYLTGTLGFDAAVDRTAADCAGRLRAAAPEGANAYFDNVGGDLFRQALPVMARGGTILVCGLSAHYEGAQAEAPPSPDDRIATVLEAVMGRQLTLRPFNNRAFVSRFDEFLDDVGPRVARGEVRLPEIVHDGLDSAPGAFARLLSGRDLGKQLVRL
jgi:hypothetical protein